MTTAAPEPQPTSPPAATPDDLLERHRDALKDLFPLPDASQLQRRTPRSTPVARAVLLVGVLGTLLALDPGGPRSDQRTAIGERRSIDLADGSRIELDADSHLQIRQHLRSRRVVLLNGRARFEVAPSRWRRFQVDAGPVQVRNYGTVFDVDRIGQRSEIRLWRGAVGVRVNGQPGEQRLRPGQQLLAGPGMPSSPRAISGADADWTTGRLQFVQTPLGEVLRSLQRYHQGALVLDDPALAGLRVSGVFDADRAADALQLLPVILPVAVHSAADGSVHITSRR